MGAAFRFSNQPCPEPDEARDPPSLAGGWRRLRKGLLCKELRLVLDKSGKDPRWVDFNAVAELEEHPRKLHRFTEVELGVVENGRVVTLRGHGRMNQAPTRSDTRRCLQATARPPIAEAPRLRTSASRRAGYLDLVRRR